MKTQYHLAIAAALLSAILSGCGSSEGGTVSPPSASPPPSAPAPSATGGTIIGKAVSAANGQGIANVTISSAGVTASTDSSGNFTMNGVLAGVRVVVRTSATGYAESLKTVAVTQGGNATVQLTLLPVGASTQINPATGGTVSMPGSPAQVDLPAGALVRSDGNSINGQVTVAITPINPALDSNQMPGDFTTVAAGNVVPIESYGALAVSLVDSQGARVNLASGRNANIRIPVGSRTITRPATIPLFYIDETGGRWVQEGTASLSADGSYYEGTVTHFSVWNADQVLNSIVVNGCVLTSQGQPAPAEVTVTSDGIDYSGTASVQTNAQGCYSIPVKSGGKATVTAVSGNLISNSISVGPSTVALSAPTPLTLALLANSVSIKLTWGQSPEDVDSHLIAPDGSHIFFESKGSLTAAPFASLDVDDITSFGPEVISIPRLMVGTYSYLVHNYSGTFSPGLTGSPTRVELSLNGQSTVFTPSAGEGNSLWWHTFDFTVNANCQVVVIPKQLWVAGTPSRSGAATYCVAP